MNQKKWQLFLILSIIYSLGVSFAANAKSPEAIPGEKIVKIKKEFLKMKSTALAQELGRNVEPLAPSLGLYLVRGVKKENTLSRSAIVDFVEPNYRVHLLGESVGIPSEPEYPNHWGLKNDGRTIRYVAKWRDQNGKLQKRNVTAPGKPDIDIRAEEAWEVTTGSKDVVVAVIDTGVNTALTDLKDQMWTNEAEANGKPGVDDDQNGFIDDIHGYDFVHNSGNVIDDNSHGTHVSSTIGAKMDGNGIVGVAWNVRIMGLKFLSKEGGGTLADAIRAIHYATQMGARIMSNSWGGGGYSGAMELAIREANDNGILFVAAAGNGDAYGNGMNNDLYPSYPASYRIPNIISVAALKNNGQLAPFSNYGARSVHVAAPGYAILSNAMDPEDKVWKPTYYNGTSMATPHVSGVAALILSDRPHANVTEVKGRITTYVTKLPSLTGKIISEGFLNAAEAVKGIPPPPPPPNPNDPENWERIPYALSSAHPYESNSKAEWTIHISGAKRFALFFKKFRTEAGFDYLKMYDGSGKFIDQVDGVRDQTFSEVIEGDTVTLKLVSDAGSNDYGFDIEQVAVQK